MYTHMHAHAHMHAHTHTHMYTHMHAHTHMHTHTCMPTCTHTHRRAHTHTHARTHTRAHTHTHTLTVAVINVSHCQVGLKMNQVIISVYRQAVRNCPWSCDLWIGYCRALERSHSNHQLIIGEYNC